MTRAAGTRLGSYEIRSRIGIGGMGEIYLAHDERLGRQVAIKLLIAEVNQREEPLRRFIKEARAASALNHPNILTIYDIGQQESGTHYIVTEFVEGVTLRERLREGALVTVLPLARTRARSAIIPSRPTRICIFPV